jgi:hypothetical protein
MGTETGVLDPRPKLLDSVCLVQPPIPKGQIKRHGEGIERRFIIWLGTCLGKRQGKHSAHFQPSSCTDSASHKCALVDHYLSPRAPTGVLEKMLSLSSFI